MSTILTVQAQVSSSGDNPPHLNFQSGRLQIEQAVSGSGVAVYSIGNGAEEDIALPGDAFAGLEYVAIQNLDATNFVTIGPKSGGVMVAFTKIKPGRFALVPLAAAVVLRGIADTAPVRIAVFAWEGD